MKVTNNIKIEQVRDFFGEVFDNSIHKKRQYSLADAAFGRLNSDSLRIHQLGEGLAKAKGLVKKHATKKIDRLLSNDKLSIWDVALNWVPYVIGNRKQIQISIDWTSFAHDSQETICINLLTSHGRATPLLWKTVDKSQIKNNRGRFEDQLLSRLKETILDDVHVTVVAGIKNRELIKLYGKGWKIEPYFRDIKDQRFGFGLSSTHIFLAAKRDRLLLIVALAYTLLTLLGAAGKKVGFDRLLKVNTVKTRTHSLICQGMFYYDYLR